MKQVLVIIFTLGLLSILLILTGFNQPEKNVRPERILFITIDTLRADHLPFYGYPRNTTPFLNDLAQKGIIFENAFSASSHTGPSHASMFTSLYPFEHGLRNNGERLSKKAFTLEDALNESSYSSAAFSAVKFMRGRVGFRAEEFKSNKNNDIYVEEENYYYSDADSNVKRIVEFFSNRIHPKKEFIWLHLYDVHQWQDDKYVKKEYLKKIKSNTEPNFDDFLFDKHKIPPEFFGSKEKTLETIDRYDSQILFVDDKIKQLFSFMTSSGLNKNTLWIITSDHGEGLGNHDYDSHGKYLYQEQLHVPLVLYWSDGRLNPARYKDTISTVDFFPTVIELLKINLKVRAKSFRGKSFLPLLSPNRNKDIVYKPAFAERRPKGNDDTTKWWYNQNKYALLIGNWKYIFRSNDRDELYDLSKDPFESNNLRVILKDRGNRMRYQILQILNSPKASLSPENDGKIDQETLKELESLGYL